MATSPDRWMIPRIGGFSFSRVPRPRAALSRFRRPSRFFRRTAAGVNNLKTHGRWAFAEFWELYAMEADFKINVESELAKLIGGGVQS